MSEEEEIASDVDRLVRAAVMGGAQIAERLARTRADRDRRAGEQSREQARQSEALHLAHRDMARVIHRQVADPRFWGKATPERIGLTYAAAHEWQGADASAQVSMGQLREGLREHHGIEVDEVLAGKIEDLSAEQREVALQVVGRYLDPSLAQQLQPPATEAGKVPVDALAQAAVDADRARADEARAQDARAVAAELEQEGARQDVPDPGAGDDERDVAVNQRVAADRLEDRAARESGDAVAAERHAGQQDVPAGGPALTVRYRTGQALRHPRPLMRPGSRSRAPSRRQPTKP